MVTSIETTAVSVSRSLPIGAPPVVLTSDEVTLAVYHLRSSDLMRFDFGVDNDTLVSLPADFILPMNSTVGVFVSVSKYLDVTLT